MRHHPRPAPDRAAAPRARHALQLLEPRLLLAADPQFSQWVLGIDLPADSGADASAQLQTLRQMVSSVRPDLQVRDLLPSMGLALLQADPAQTLDPLAASLSSLSGFRYLQPDLVGQPISIPPDAPPSTQWAMNNTGQSGGRVDADIDAPEAWQLSRGDGVIVGIMDSGVDYHHPDLAPNIFVNTQEIAANGIDDDHNGFVDDTRGWDFNAIDNDPFDETDHGTWVAGAVVAAAPNVTILPLKVFTGYNGVSQFAQAQAIQYAITLKEQGYNIRVLNRSIRQTSAIEGAFQDAILALADAGILLVNGAGNDARTMDSPPVYPSALHLPNSIFVAATDHNDALAGFSGFGRNSVELAAPGVDIISTQLNSTGYGTVSGTSLSSPLTAAAAALCFSYRPDATVSQVRDALFRGSDPISALAGKTITGGRLNARAALDWIARPTQTPVPGTLQFEDYDSGTEGTSFHDTDIYNSGGAYRADGVDLERAGSLINLAYTRPGEWLSYALDIATTATYRAELRIASPAAGGQFHLTLDGQRIGSGNFSVPNTGSWQTYQTLGLGNLNLPAGPHTLRLVIDSAASTGYTANFDWVRFTQAPSEQRRPFGSAPIALPGYLQAEDFDYGGQGLAYNDSTPGNASGAYRPSESVDIEPTSGGYNIGYATAGEWLTYSVDVTASGTYTFYAQLASPASGGRFHVELLPASGVGPAVDLTGSLSVPKTGSWQKWQTISKSGIALTAGQYVLKLALDANSSAGFVGNINWLRFVSTPTNGPFNGAPAPVPGTVTLAQFDFGGQGVAYSDTTSANLGGSYRPDEGVDIETVNGLTNIGYTAAGEWLQYTLNVDHEADYTIDVAVSSPSTGAVFYLSFDSIAAADQLVPNTGGWQTYRNVRQSVHLTAGQHILRLVFKTNATNGFAGNYRTIQVA